MASERRPHGQTELGPEQGAPSQASSVWLLPRIVRSLHNGTGSPMERHPVQPDLPPPSPQAVPQELPSSATLERCQARSPLTPSSHLSVPGQMGSEESRGGCCPILQMDQVTTAHTRKFGNPQLPGPSPGTEHWV